MKNNPKLCRTQDYDFYSIPLPVKMLTKKKRDKYLYSELTKYHPCFTDSCCYDSKLTLSKRGFTADVVVMQKYMLAEYKGRNKQKSVHIKECRFFPFFYSGTISGGWLFMILVILAVSAAAGIITAGFIEQEEIVLPEQAEEALPTDSIAEKLLAHITKEGGIISSLFWRMEGFSERLEVCVDSLYPETLAAVFPQADFSTIAFNDKNPSFTVNLENKLSQTQIIQTSGAGSLQTSLRIFLMENEAQIIEESVKPYAITFIVPAKEEGQAEKILGKILSFIIENELPLSSLRLNCENNSLNVALSFSQGRTVFLDRICNAVNNSHFRILREEKLPVISKPVVRTEKESEVKIGRLIKEDGSIVEFFKNEAGKIISKDKL